MAQHQCVLAVVGGVVQPPLRARLARIGRVAAVEDDALVGTSAALDLPDGDVGQRRGCREEPFGFVQPPSAAVEIKRRNHFTVDPVKGMHIADRSARPQPEKDDFVAQGVQGERDSGPRNRKLARFAVEIVPPGLGVVATGSCERPDHRAQRPRARRLTARRTRPWFARFFAVRCRHDRRRYGLSRGLNRGFVHGVKGRLATVVRDQCLQPRPAPDP